MSADIHKTGANTRRGQDEDSAETTEVVRKSIFILKAKPHSLRSAENFLGNRSWDLRPTTDVKMALMSLLKEPVDYVLLGVDHPNPSIVKMPEILSQTLKVPIILFAESMTAQSSMILRSSKYPYVLFPPVSGPSIERMLLKIEKEKTLAANEKAGEGAAAASGVSFAEQDMAKVFAGEGQSPMLGTNLGYGTGTNHTSASERGLLGSDGQPLNQSAHQSGIAYDPRASGFNPAVPDLAGLEAGDPLSFNLGHPQGGGGSGQGHNPANSGGFGHGQNPANSGSSGHGQNPAHGGGFAQRQDPARAMNPLFTPGAGPGGDPLDPFQAYANLVPHDLLLTPDDAHYKRIIEHQSILSSCTKMALKAVVAPSPNLIVHIPILRSSNVACFDVESPNVSGVVVVAFGSDRQADAKFTRELREKVLLYMREHDIDFTVNDAMNLKIEQVEFEAWSANEAAFLHKTVHAGDEIALSFFMNSDLKTPLEVSDDSRMLKINIDEIRADVPLDFDIYLHLPANQKYVRYVAKAGAISTAQWNRLTTGGVAEMHVQKAAAPLVKRYRIQNFINDTVDAYVTAKKKAA